MELYLDSANLAEIKEAFDLGFIHGLTTTPTFMHRDGVTDIDSLILELAEIAPILQVEALGQSAQEILDETHRLLDIGLDKDKTVFKIPISLQGAKACNKLVGEGLLVNLHLIYTIQQAYIGMSAGASYICPLVGRLQDQGHDALDLVEQCVEAVDYHEYDSKIMFSSVRHPEHVRNAINIGVHACTIPWKVMNQLTDNHFTQLGTSQFFEHTRMLTKKVGDVIRPASATIGMDKKVLDALVEMTQSKLGAVTILDANAKIHRIFTDGDLRRLLEQRGGDALQMTLGELAANNPLSIDASESLLTSSNLFKANKVDTIIVKSGEEVIGMLDIQDLLMEN